MTAASSAPPIAQAVAGSIGSACSNAIAYPLDLIASRMQLADPKAKRPRYGSVPMSLQTIIRQEGVGALWQGVVSDSVSTALSNFIFFLLHSSLSTRWAKQKELQTTPQSIKSSAKATKAFTAIEELMLGTTAGIISRLLVTPISQITVRQQTSSSSHDNEESDVVEPNSQPSVREICSQIYEERGWTGFFAGFKVSCLLTLNPSITLYLFALFKLLLLPKRKQEHPPAAAVFITSALASAVASTICFPLILAKTRLQSRSASGKHYKSTQEVLVSLYRSYGISGLFIGLQGQIAKGFLTQGLTMLAKEKVELLIYLLYRRSLQKGQ